MTGTMRRRVATIHLPVALSVMTNVMDAVGTAYPTATAEYDSNGDITVWITELLPDPPTVLS